MRGSSNSVILSPFLISDLMMLQSIQGKIKSSRDQHSTPPIVSGESVVHSPIRGGWPEARLLGLHSTALNSGRVFSGREKWELEMRQQLAASAKHSPEACSFHHQDTQARHLQPGSVKETLLGHSSVGEGRVSGPGSFQNRPELELDGAVRGP